MANEIKKAEKFELAAEDVDFKEMVDGIAEELDGLGRIEFTKVVVPNGGVTEFDVDGEDVSELTGVIVARVNTNAYFDSPYSGDNDRPACASNDGVTGVDRDGTMHKCETCPRNQFKDEGGKDCTNRVNLYMLRSGEIMPIQLVLPPTSIKSLRDYIGKKLLSKGMRSSGVVTKVSLEKVKDNFTYSRATFDVEEKLDAATKESMKQYSAAFSEFVKEMAANSQHAAVEADDNVIDVAYEDLPFTEGEVPEFLR